jgi:hypothetical protein
MFHIDPTAPIVALKVAIAGIVVEIERSKREKNG